VGNGSAGCLHGDLDGHDNPAGLPEGSATSQEDADVSANAWKWLLVLGLGGLIGLGNVFSDATFPGWWEIVRHAGGGVVAAAVGLKVSLTPKVN
jgi:hypothetical protein